MRARHLTAILATAACVAALLVVGTLPAEAGGSTIDVTTTEDVVDAGDGVISLREAFNSINDDDDGIAQLDLVPGATYELTICGVAGDEDANVSGDLDHVDNEHLIVEAGTVVQTCPGERVVESLHGGATLNLARGTYTGGQTAGDGGGARVAGTFQLTLGGRLEDNQASGSGGGAWAGNAVFVVQATVTDNVAGNVGGGVWANGLVTSYSTTWDHNRAGVRAGGLWAGALATILRSTITQNVAPAGGGVDSGGDVDINTSTVVANRAEGDGANVRTADHLSLEASIVALGSGGTDCDATTVANLGYNVGADGSCGTNAEGGIDGLHPMLADLADLGSLGVNAFNAVRRTVSPSPAFDHDVAPCVGATTDQYFVPRPTGAACSAGSFEPAPAACAPTFTDVPEAHPFYEEICWLGQMDIAGGFGDSTFQPLQAVTRQSMSAFMFRLAGSPLFPAPETASFTDVATSHPFFAEIEWMADEEITGGFPDGRFKPSQAVTRQAMAAFLFRVAGEPTFTPPGSPSFSDVPASHPFFDEIEWLADTGVSTGFPNGTFKPVLAVSRQAMAAFLLRLAEDVVLAGI